MGKLLSLFLLMPVLAKANGITVLKGIYNKNEDRNISSKIIIDTSSSGRTISKYFYGSHVDSYSELPSKALVDELQLGRIRVGGNEFDVLNWKLNKSINANGDIFNMPSITSLIKSIGSYNVDGIFQINLTGFQPEFDGSNYVITRNFSADAAYEMIKYLKGSLKLNFKDVSLGNEFSIWNETFSKIWPTTDGITADEYINRYIEYAMAIRKAQEEVSGNPNDIKIWGPEISTSWYDWNTGNFSNDCAWTDVKGQVACSYGPQKFKDFIPYFFSKLKLAESDPSLNPKKYKLLDYISIHYYPNFRTKIADPDSIIVNDKGQQMIAEMLESTRVFYDTSFVNRFDISSPRNTIPNILGRMNLWIKQYYPEARLAINEFAVDSDYRSIKYHPIIRPLYLADSIGIFAREGVEFLNLFMLSSQRNSNLPWSLIKGGNRENLFYMYKLFSNNFKGALLTVSDNMGDLVNSYATLDGNTINLSVINKTPKRQEIQIYVKNSTVKKLITFNAPPWSASILKFDKNPGLFVKKFDIQEFGATEMGIEIK